MTGSGRGDGVRSWGWLQVEQDLVAKTETKDKNINSSKWERANDLKFRLLAHGGEKKK